MLVLTRKKNETITIGENIELTIIDIQGENVKLGIKAPKEVKILRAELQTEIVHENKDAQGSNVETILALEKIFLKNSKKD